MKYYFNRIKLRIFIADNQDNVILLGNDYQAKELEFKQNKNL